MRKVAMLAALICLVGGLVPLAGAWAQQEQTARFLLELRTETMLPPFDISKLPKIPGMPDLFAPRRVIDGDATYEHKAVAPIFVTVPADLKLTGNRLVLEVPKPEPATTPGEAGGDQATPTQYKFTSNLYWHPDKAEGPITQTFDSSNMPQMPGPKPGAMMDPRSFNFRIMTDIEKTASGSETKLPANVIGTGNYVLNTGGIAVLDGFLPPTKVLSPTSLTEAKLSEGINVQWQPVAGARGYILQAMAMKNEGKNVGSMTMWVSTLKEPPERVRTDYEQATTISDDLEAGILLPPDATSCMIPPGIFPDDANMFMLKVIAVGNDYYNQSDGLVVRGKIRSVWQAFKMAGMSGIPGMPPMGTDGSDSGDAGDGSSE